MSKITLFSITLCLFFMAGCTSMPHVNAIPSSNAHHIIYVVYSGWHTSVVLDAKQLEVQSPILATYLQGQHYARVGWGDGDYFTGKNTSIGAASKALVLSGYSAVQLLTYDAASLHEIPSDTIVPLAITDEGFNRLARYIGESVALNAKGIPIPLSAIEADSGVFFQATGHYSVFNNCNTWSGQALQLAGLPVASRLTAQGIFKQAREISHLQRQAQADLFSAASQ